MINGRIVKGIGGFYYVKTVDCIYECKPRGLFRKDNIVPAVGDRVVIETKEGATGVIREILKRDNYLIRPPVANINLAVIVFAYAKPDPNLYLLDRFLTNIEKNDIDICICFNKSDIADKGLKDSIKAIYMDAGYLVVNTSAKTGEGINQLKDILKEHITIFAGPSGVGKSSLLNQIQPGFGLKTGEISQKSERGKHTTRHVELLELDFGGSVLDTPGFTSLDIDEIEEEELQYYFPEFIPFINKCRFNGCMHIHEPSCAIKEKVDANFIAQTRYNSYALILKEIQEKRRNKYD